MTAQSDSVGHTQGDDDPALVRYVARELSADSNPKILIQELQRDYGYTPDAAARLVTKARSALAASPTLRGDEEVIGNLEVKSRSTAAKVQSGLVALAAIIAIGAYNYFNGGHINVPAVLVGVVLVGLVAWFNWRRTERVLNIHRQARRR